MISRINPILLFVKDFQKSLAFYRDALGLTVESMEEVHEEYATFRVGETVFGIHGGYKGKRGGPLHIHFEVKDIRNAVRELKARGVAFTEPVKKMPWGAYETSFVDPDGNEFDLTEPTDL